MGLFITFEGSEGCGKSTQARLLAEHLRTAGYQVSHVREPGGTAIGDQIRSIVLGMQNTEMDPTAESLLFSASRAQLVNQVIRPQLAAGGIVICDRYADSTYAYQGYGLGRNLADLRTLTAIATAGLVPDVTFWLRIDPAVGLRRKLHPNASAVEWNRLDAHELAFHLRVAEGYDALAHAEPNRWVTCDASQSIEAIAAQIRTRVSTLLHPGQVAISSVNERTTP
jgi:dTMP kinase